MRGASRDSLTAAAERVDAVLAAGDVEAAAQLSASLLSVTRLLSAERALARMLADPVVAVAARQELLARLLSERLDPASMEVLRGLVESRWSRPADLVDAVELLGAQAAFAVAEREQTLDDVEDQLFRFARIIESNPSLRAALSDPAGTAEHKRQLVDALLTGKVAQITLNLVDNVVRAPRGRPIGAAVDALCEQAAQRRRRLIAIVRVASALTEEQRDRLTAALGRSLGHDVRLQVQVDPAVQGGVVVRVGDELFDGSIARRLAQVRRRLAG
ncbi:MAG TPA: F0F1 ATP synthase subunit delta [Mycobacteriales bacterium]|nr:F0F1 ATP synthase subunit delta [Mycobacteriales bacterium]